MSNCTFIASNHKLLEKHPSKEYPVIINLDKGIIDDGNADDNFYLLDFKDVDLYTDKQYGVIIEWNYTDGRANKIIEYIKEALQYDSSIELWHVWLLDYYEYENRPIINKYRMPIEELTTIDIKELENYNIWNNSDRPNYYCLEIIK